LQVFRVVSREDEEIDYEARRADGEQGVSGSEPVADPLSYSHGYAARLVSSSEVVPKLASMEQAPAPAFAESRAADCSLTMLDRPRSPTVAEMARTGEASVAV